MISNNHPNNNVDNNQPVALLVIYDKGWKFKYQKYYLKKGNNFIGSNPHCHICIQPIQTERIPEKAANLYITDDLATIQCLVPASVFVLSNIKKRNNLMVQIGVGTKYVVEMEKDFMIAGRKAMMQISSLQQLLLVKGIKNENLFDLHNKNAQINREKNHQKPMVQNNNQSQFQATIPLDECNFEATVPLDNYEYEATLLIDDPNMVNGGYQATLPLEGDIDLIPQSYQRNSQSYQQQRFNKKQPIFSLKQSKKEQIPTSLNNFSQLSSQKYNNKDDQNRTNFISKINSQAQISMPSTIKQQQMPATIKQDQNKQIIFPSSNNNMLNSFPPTIQQSQNQPKQQKKKPNLTKSEPVYRQMKNEKFSDKPFHSLAQKKISVPQSFEDLFGGEDLVMSNKTVSLKSQKSGQLRHDQKGNKKPQKNIKQTNSENMSQGTQKLESENEEENKRSMHKINKNQGKLQKNLQKIQQTQNQNSQKPQLKKFYVLGKINKADTDRLLKKGYNKVEIKQDETTKNTEIDLLLIQGELKLTKILMISLIKGRQIKPIGWINNQAAKLSGKLQGFLWQSIQKRKGRGNTIFSSNKNFHIQQEIRELFQDAMQLAGANIVPQLTKTKSKITIHIVVDQKTSQGRELYEQKKNYKNWSFYSKKMIIESILMGEQIIEKYKLDGYSF